MSTFYENLNDGLDIDEALRDSKLKYLQNADQLNAHPYLWSGYVSIGATEPLMNTFTLSNIFSLFTGLAGLLIILLIFLRRIKNRS
jgi:hypothetical protein